MSDMQNTRGWSKISLTMWLTWFVSFLVLEAVGLSDDHDDWPPLTRVVRKFLPAPLVIGFLGWLFAHAVETYQNPTD